MILVTLVGENVIACGFKCCFFSERKPVSFLIREGPLYFSCSEVSPLDCRRDAHNAVLTGGAAGGRWAPRQPRDLFAFAGQTSGGRRGHRSSSLPPPRKLVPESQALTPQVFAQACFSAVHSVTVVCFVITKERLEVFVGRVKRCAVSSFIGISCSYG